MNNTRPVFLKMSVNILFALLLLPILIGVISLYASAQDTETPAPTSMPSDTPIVTAEPSYNASLALGGDSSGVVSILNSSLLPLAAATMSVIVIVGGVAFYMGDRSRAPELPNEPSHDDLYKMVLGEPHRRVRKPKL